MSLQLTEKAEIERLKAQITAQADAIDYCHGMTATDFVQMTKDAERYRWLRENYAYAANIASTKYRLLITDSVIDAARERQ